MSSQPKIVGSIAAGDSFSDIYGIGRLIYVSLPQILALFLEKQLVLLPQTIGPFKGVFARAIACYTLKRARKVYSHDHSGFSAVYQLLCGEQCQLDFCYDMGFLLEPNIMDERIPPWLAELDDGLPLVGLNVSRHLYIDGYSRNNMFGLEADYRLLIQGLIHYFVRQQNAHVMLVPRVFGAAENSESDTAAW